MIKALIIASNGQDGKILANIEKNNHALVYGIEKPGNETSLILSEKIEIDLKNTNTLYNYILNNQFDRIYYTAALHGPDGFDYLHQWDKSELVNNTAFHAVLNAVLKRKGSDVIAYFNSGKVFPKIKNIDESTPRNAKGIYESQKNYAYNLIEAYRGYGLKILNFWLFNHESSYRSTSFFSKKIINCLKNAIEEKGKTQKTKINTLNFYCDWGLAEEYMKIINDIVMRYESIYNKDFVLATGNTVHARELVNELFLNHDLNYRNYIVEHDPCVIAEYYSVNCDRINSINAPKSMRSGLEVFNYLMDE
jgi:GDP-D-mannose dehydratase